MSPLMVQEDQYMSFFNLKKKNIEKAYEPCEDQVNEVYDELKTKFGNKFIKITYPEDGIRKCEIWFNDRSRKILKVDLVKENRCCPIGMRGLDMFGNVSELEIRFPMLNWKKDLKKMFRKIERILNKREYQI